MNWRHQASILTSRGASSARATSLADLHRRRNETQSQYFTPEWVARGIWKAFAPVMATAKESGLTRFSVLDSSVGSGRLFEGAPVDDLALFGLDTDPRCIDALQADAHAAGLNYEFLTGSMADLRAKDFDFAVINPPFSLQLESPNLSKYACNSFGRFGQGTSALSHEYALEQALEAAQYVAAVLPVTMEPYCRAQKRLAQIVYLPRTAFKTEGANVQCAVFFFAGPNYARQVLTEQLSKGADWPALSPSLCSLNQRSNPRFTLVGCHSSEPTITLPVTSNKRVELHHNNRRIVLKYHCGLVQAKVANGLLKQTAKGKRLPASLPYAGSARLMLDVLLLQDQPDRELDELAREINCLGGEAWISPTLRGFYSRLIKRHRRAIRPMRRVLKTKGGSAIELKALQNTFLEPGNFKSPSVRKDELLQAKPLGGAYEIQHKGHSATLRRDEVLKRYTFLSDDRGAEGQWMVKHEGLPHHFPMLAQHYKKKLQSHGVSWLAEFQEYSLIEGLMSPYGYIGAWEQGSGKARYALTLALLEPGRSLIVVDSGLLPEMLMEIKKLGLADEKWRVLKRKDMPTTKISITTYRELRAGIRITYPKTILKAGETKTHWVNKVVRTSADRWRRLFRTVICDEGGILASSKTQQTSAVKKLAGRKVIVLDGTPQNNYPRDMLPISAISAGNGRAHQAYGIRERPYLRPELRGSANNCQRGEDAFFENHIVTQWVTNEFREDLQSGAKREVPKINNVTMFRDWLAPNIQRRLRDEPDLSVFNNCPKPKRQVYPIDWEPDHFRHYLRVATDFAHWYKQARDGAGKALNLVTILSRIGAVQRAANAPHVASKNSMRLFTPFTSKQAWALERLKHWTGKGKKSILYAQSPEVLARLQRALQEAGIASVLFTGEQDIAKRSKALNEQFRFGDTPVLLSSWVGQRGLNLEQAEVVLFYERAWSATKEEQAIYRTQRPSQTRQVMVEYGHLVGSIDEYCAQLVEWKRKAAEAGLDYGDQMDAEEEFMHLDTLLNRFCEDVHDLSAQALRHQLAA